MTLLCRRFILIVLVFPLGKVTARFGGQDQNASHA